MKNISFIHTKRILLFTVRNSQVGKIIFIQQKKKKKKKNKNKNKKNETTKRMKENLLNYILYTVKCMEKEMLRKEKKKNKN